MTYTATAPDLEHFLCDTDEVLDRIDAIDPRAYDKSRNELGGATTWLGPFLTHGITDTREVAERVLEPPGGEPRSPGSCYRLLFELAWREFFHRTWQLEGEEVFGDMHRAQHGVVSEKLPCAVLSADTGIDVVDATIAHLLEQGTMHNHARMWTAAIVCNIGRSGWWQGARWLHHHLLDGDLASNTLSWQWVAGTFSNKRYLANQENIDRFSRSRQSGSWLDLSYDEVESMPAPERFSERAEPTLPMTLHGRPIERLEGGIALRSIWHLDPRWEHTMERELVFVDTDLIAAWPLSAKRWRFIAHWAERCGADIVHGSASALAEAAREATVVRREYPACRDWPGQVEERRWLYPMPDKEFASFSKYWKQVRGSLGL